MIEDRVAELSSPDFPDERLLVCLNPRLRQSRRRKRHELLDLTEARLEAIAAAVHRPRRPLRSVAAISRRVERELHRLRMQKHFQLTITEGTLTWSRDLASIAEEAQLDGIYVVRTSLRDMGADQAVEACQSLAKVEWAFRCLKTSRPAIRPVHVHCENHVRGHVFLCMLAYYVEWHLRRRLAPLLFEDDDRQTAKARRQTAVEEAHVSQQAQRKAATRRTPRPARS